MKPKQLFIILTIFMGLAILAGSFYVVWATEEVNAGDLNVKSYDSITKTVTISDDTNKELVSIRLLTGLNHKVPIGSRYPIAEYEVNSIETAKVLVTNIELYDLEDKNKPLNRQIEYKVKGTKQINVNDYEYICNNVTLGNSTIEVRCNPNLIGSHYEDRTTWTPLEKVDFNKGEKIIIGIFIDVKDGDRVEWIPTFEVNNKEYKVEEWAVWEASLEVDLIAFYNFEEASGDLIDAHGLYNKDGTNAGADYQQDGILGFGWGFVDDNTDSVDLGNNWEFADEISISVWIDLNTNADNMDIVSKYPSADFTFYTEADDDISWVPFISGAKTAKYAYGSALEDAGWIHIVGVYNSSHVVIYVNGIQRQSVAATGNLDVTATHMNLGRRLDSSNWFDGQMDELGIWNRTITPDEVTALYNDGTGITYDVGVKCMFLGNVTDQTGTALVGANITMINHDNVDENYENVTIAGGLWSYELLNSTKTWLIVASYNETLISQAMGFISGTC